MLNIDNIVFQVIVEISPNNETRVKITACEVSMLPRQSCVHCVFWNDPSERTGEVLRRHDFGLTRQIPPEPINIELFI